MNGPIPALTLVTLDISTTLREELWKEFYDQDPEAVECIVKTPECRINNKQKCYFSMVYAWNDKGRQYEFRVQNQHLVVVRELSQEELLTNPNPDIRALGLKYGT